MGSLITFALLPVYTRNLSPKEFGVLSLILITISFGSTLFSFGLNTGYMIKYYKEDLAARKKLFSIVLLLLLSVLPLTIIFIPFSAPFRNIFSKNFGAVHLLLIGLTILFTLYYRLCSTLLKVELKAKFFVVYTIGYAILTASLNLYFLIVLKLSYFAFLYSALITSFCFMIIGLIHYRSFIVRIDPEKDKSSIFSLFRVSWPVVPLQASDFVLTSGDQYVLKMMTGASEVGTYSIGYRFGAFLNNFFIIPFFSAYNPYAFKLFSEDPIAFKRSQKKYLLIYTFVLSVCLILASILFENLFKIFIDRRYWASYQVIGIIVLAYFFQGLSFLFNVVQIMREKLYYSMYITFGCAVLNIILNIILIPHWGISGAAAATFMCYLLMAVGAYFINNSMLKIDYDIARVLMILIVCAVTIILQHTVNLSAFWPNLAIKSLWALLGFCVLYFLNIGLVKGFNREIRNMVLRFRG